MATMSSATAVSAPCYHIHVLVYGRILHKARVERLTSTSSPPNVQIVEFNNDCATNLHSNDNNDVHDVLVLDGKFVQSNSISLDAMPKEVRSAISYIIACGGRVCTDRWLNLFVAGGWSERVGILGEDVTDECCRMLGYHKANDCDGTGSDDADEKVSGNVKENDVIDLLSDNESEEDEIVVVSVKPPPKSTGSNGKKRKRIKGDSTAVDTKLSPREQERQRRISDRNLKQRPEFRATWLQGVDGIKEAKVKATLLHAKYEKGQSPEERVLENANAYMNKVKRGSTKKWNFVFEECRNQMEKAQKENDGNASAAAPAAGGGDENEPLSFQKVRERNHKIGARMKEVFAAETTLDEFKRVQLNRSYEKGEQSRRDFRMMQYNRVIRTVETYPIPVTLHCLEYPPPWPDACHHGSLCERLSVPRIKCKENSSTRSRLIRAILFVDKESDARLYLQLDKNKTSHQQDEYNLRNPDYKAVNELRHIWGIGLATASKLCLWGVFSVDDLRRDKAVYDTLNRQQKVGVRHYEDFIMRIPREEVQSLGDHVTSVVTKLSDGDVTVTIGGSFRRGAPSSGDIDMILLPAEGADDKAAVNIMEGLLDELRKENFLTDDLTVPGQFGENSGPNPGTDSRSYMGVCRLQDRPDRRYRRIDIKAYPACQGPFALIYFTGDTHFNRSLRYFAKKAGLTLSDAGLSVCVRRHTAKGWKRTSADPSVRCNSEEDVFKALGIKYVSPTYRNCHNLDKMRIQGQATKRWDWGNDMDESDYEDSDSEY